MPKKRLQAGHIPASSNRDVPRFKVGLLADPVNTRVAREVYNSDKGGALGVDATADGDL